MAIETPIESAKPPVKLEERTWRANIETPRGGQYTIQVYRQRTKLDEDGEVVGEPVMLLRPINRFASKIARETVRLRDGTVISAAQMMEAMPKFFDRWAEEDAK